MIITLNHKVWKNSSIKIKKRLKWKKTIQVELDSLEKQEVFKSIAQTPKVVNPIIYK